MRRAYVESSEPFDRALNLALQWAGGDATIHAPSTAIVDENELEQLGYAVTSPSSKSRFYARPHGVVGTFLNLAETLEVERRGGVDGLVVVGAHGPSGFPGVSHHGPWVTAFSPAHLGGQVIAPIATAPAALRAAVRGLTGIAVRNQGLLDQRERSRAVQAMRFLLQHGFPLDSDALMVEALLNEWGGSGPEQLHGIAVALNNGTKLKAAAGKLNPGHPSGVGRRQRTEGQAAPWLRSYRHSRLEELPR